MRRAPTKEAAKAAAMPNQSGVGEATRTLGVSDGLAGPSIQVLSPPDRVDPIEVSSNLST